MAPPEVMKHIEGPRIRRRVWLQNNLGDTYAYAISWWNEARYREVMSDRTLPIGATLSTTKLEVHREILSVFSGRNHHLQASFQHLDGDAGKAAWTGASSIWARTYLMSNAGKPLSLICEVFNPSLQLLLGPYTACTKASGSDEASQAGLDEF